MLRATVQATVGINSWVAHYSETVFGPDAAVFRPERWLDSDSERLRSMENYNFPVSPPLLVEPYDSFLSSNLMNTYFWSCSLVLDLETVLEKISRSWKYPNWSRCFFGTSISNPRLRRNAYRA